MKKALLLVITILAAACSSVKKTQVALNSGNYDGAIAIALDKLRENKTKKSNQPYVIMLEQAFAKATDRDLQQIRFLQAGNNLADLEDIYESYNRIVNRQDMIRPLLPLHLEDENRKARFEFKDYTHQIITSRNALSDYLYDHATSLLQQGMGKFDYRKAYDDLSYLNNINPGYKDAAILMQEARAMGVDYVRVSMTNESKKIIPERLEQDLLNFNTYGLNDLWTEYHNEPRADINYDYEMSLNIKDIAFTPEQVSEKVVLKEKQVQDGYKYVLDQNGNVKKDSLGNDIKVENFITVRSRFQQFTQFKAVNVTGQVIFKDLVSGQMVNTYPIGTEFIFRHYYAEHQGDQRALETADIDLLQAKLVPFPSNEEMVYNAGEDIKHRVMNILKKQQFNQSPRP